MTAVSAPAIPTATDDAAATETWIAAAGGVSWVPAEYAGYQVSLAEAARQLRVGELTLEALVAAGMPSAVGADGTPCVDAYDLFNLALDVGWRRALPVVGFRGAMRWLMGDEPQLTATTRWRSEIGPPADGWCNPVHLAAPLPQLHDGTWQDDDARPIQSGPDGVQRVTLGCDELLRGEVAVRGLRTPVRSPAIVDAVQAVLAAEVRWAKLPMTLQQQPAAVTAMGYATCVSASAKLHERLTSQGFEVTTRRGWLMGSLPAPHSWLEVRDEDGIVKVIDPVLVLLRRRLDDLEAAAAVARPTRVTPACDLHWLADGLLVNRVLPTTASGGDELAVTAAGAAAPVVATFRPTLEPTV